MNEPDGEDNGNNLHVIRNEEEYFHNWVHVLEFFNEIIDPSQWKYAWEKKWEPISTSLLIFQEQPTLLTPHLEKIIVPLTNYLIEILQQQEEEGKKFQVSLSPTCLFVLSFSFFTLLIAFLEDGKLTISCYLQSSSTILPYPRIQTCD